ncbi:hypothetical protein T03_6205 [Trichinella britovi]|uniref:Uncharacterized protein n=1 Tax=Trichinella britovi TaxID=45882 RepID=A0A0V1DGJ7_TRIBR|nr:hypothetical protein T03_6205 [Trichinella britovi]
MAANCWPLLMLTVLVDSYYSSRTIFQQENMQYFFHESFLHNHKNIIYSNPFYALSFVVQLYIVFSINCSCTFLSFSTGACFVLHIDIFQKKESSLLVVSCDLGRSGHCGFLRSSHQCNGRPSLILISFSSIKFHASIQMTCIS